MERSSNALVSHYSDTLLDDEPERAARRGWMLKRERIVIIGASLSGASAAAGRRDGGFDGEIHLIGEEPQLPYNRPPLSKGYLRGEERFGDQLVHPAGYYAERD